MVHSDASGGCVCSTQWEGQMENTVSFHKAPQHTAQGLSMLVACGDAQEMIKMQVQESRGKVQKGHY